ncbi:MAG: hypothetical protein ABIA59_05830 [Candidatus Latescibacterota bacterium]
MTSNSTDIREIRKFGTIALIFFGCLFLLGLWKEKPLPIALFGALALLGLGFIVIPARLRPVHAGWLRIAHFIGKVITTIVLALAYYLVITPSALLKAIFGGRPLPLKPDKKASTYWVDRTEAAQPRERFLKRF